MENTALNMDSIERDTPWFLKNYLINTIIKQQIKGSVYIANDFNKDWFHKHQVLIKQGRGNLDADEFGRTMKDNLKWQMYLHQSLFRVLRLPKIKEFFRYKHNFYLIMEYIEGVCLTEKLSSIYDNRTWNNLSTEDRTSILKLLMQVTKLIGKLHAEGFLHRDITPDNFMVDRYNEVVMIDLELAYAVGEEHPAPPYSLGTPGYMSPEQRLRRTPTVKEDIFGLGALLLSAFTNFPPLKFDMENPLSLNKPLAFLGVPRQIRLIIRQCLSEEKKKRPDLTKINLVIDDLYRAEN